MESMINQQVTIYYDDRSHGNNIARKDGFLLGFESNSVIIKNTNGFRELIPLNRIIRIIEK